MHKRLNMDPLFQVWTTTSAISFISCQQTKCAIERATCRLFSPPQPYSHSVRSNSTADCCRQLSDILQLTAADSSQTFYNVSCIIYFIYRKLLLLFLYTHIVTTCWYLSSTNNICSSPIFWECTRSSGEYKLTKYEAMGSSVTWLLQSNK
jgi:hypothetical protein